jgi:hypothetical protein
MLVPQKKNFQVFSDNYRILWVSHNYYKTVEYMYIYYVNVTPLTQKGPQNLAQVVTLLYLGGARFESQTKNRLSCIRFSQSFPQSSQENARRVL